jgi:hypothetical protein
MSEAPDLTALAADLRRLAPAPAGLDRDALLFRAGRASARRGWAWPAATALATATAASLALVLALRPPEVQTVERPVVVVVEKQAPTVPQLQPTPPEAPSIDATEPEPTPPAPGPAGRYLQVQEHLLRWGLDGLGQPSEPEARPVSLESLLQ